MNSGIILAYLYPSIYGYTVLVFSFTSSYVGLLVRYQIRNVQLHGGGGYVGAARWHIGKEVTTATWWWLKVYMMPVTCSLRVIEDRNGG